MKKVGLVGGIGPSSTIDYYKGIIDGYRTKTGGDNNPHILIDSINLAEMYALAAEKNWPEFTARLVTSIGNLEAGGATFAAMAANTAHIVFDEVKRQSPLPLISLIDETCKKAQNLGCRRVIIFGTAFTMSSGLYTDAFARYGMEAFVPSDADQKLIHGIIFPNLQDGIVLPTEKKAILEVANQLLKEKDADGLVLGCTELPLIIKEGDLQTTLLDTTQIHIDSIIQMILE